MKTFRQIYKFLVPSWLSSDELDHGEGEGGRVLVSISAMLDAYAERVRLGLEARMPSRATPSANALTAGDRGIVRGKVETEDQFKARLLAWRTPRTHLVRGNAYEALDQLWHYFRGTDTDGINSAHMRTIDAHGNSYEILTAPIPGDEVGESRRDDIGVFDWDNSDPDVDWSRFWLILLNPSAISIAMQFDLGNVSLWGGTLGLPGHLLGIRGMTPADILAIRSFFQDRNWHPGNTQPEWFIVSFTGAGLGGGIVTPDGTYKNWSRDVFGTQTYTRDRDYRYISLNPNYNNRYSGNPEGVSRFCVDSEMVDTVPSAGPNYGGDPTSATAWNTQTLPNGETYRGNPARFPVDVLLLDDGSIPR